MRVFFSLMICCLISATTGCGGSGKTSIREATAEDIQKQNEAEKQANAEESEMRKSQPKEKTVQQSVEEQERSRRR